nr:reverse transcriptase domain, reverse transcriptase zinc-binding domain protein [Tanacetum cinerariifolium]
ERFLKQKAKVQRLKEGDNNSAYFHKAVKGRTSRSRIDVVMDVVGTIFVNDRVTDAFVSHYERRVKEADGFKYHQFYSEMELINLCFADALFLFAHGDVNSAKIIMESLDEFKHVSGLTPSYVF